MEKINKLDEYQEKTRLTAIYPAIANNKFLYPVLGLVGESGELANKVKKIFRDDNGVVSDEKKEAMVAELGDILWYCSRIADELDVSLSDVATSNINKLLSRQNRDVLIGSGDNR